MSLLRRLNAIFELIWWGIHDVTGMSSLNRKLILRRAHKDLELAQQLRTAGMTKQADALTESVAKHLQTHWPANPSSTPRGADPSNSAHLRERTR